MVPTIVSLQDHLETIRQAEIDRVRGRLGPLSPEQELAVEALTRGIISKIMHTPITHPEDGRAGAGSHHGGRCGAATVQSPGQRSAKQEPQGRRKDDKKAAKSGGASGAES